MCQLRVSLLNWYIFERVLVSDISAETGSVIALSLSIEHSLTLISSEYGIIYSSIFLGGSLCICHIHRKGPILLLMLLRIKRFTNLIERTFNDVLLCWVNTAIFPVLRLLDEIREYHYVEKKFDTCVHI